MASDEIISRNEAYHVPAAADAQCASGDAARSRHAPSLHYFRGQKGFGFRAI